jgi:hypothetical protein
MHKYMASFIYMYTYIYIYIYRYIPLSVASAFAIRVFEQPGGPYRRIPFGGDIPVLIGVRVRG